MAISNKWLMSSFSYYLDFFTAPLFIVAAIYMGDFEPAPMLAGVLAWSLTEYLVHRFLFHSLYRQEHWTHHINVLAYIGISGWRISSAYAVVLMLALMTGLTSAYAGFVLGYLGYIFLHYVMHRPHHWAYRFIPWLVANHNLHHQKGIEKNFGVTSPLWDHVLGTFTRTEIPGTGNNPAHGHGQRES